MIQSSRRVGSRVRPNCCRARYGRRPGNDRGPASGKGCTGSLRRGHRGQECDQAAPRAKASSPRRAAVIGNHARFGALRRRGLGSTFRLHTARQCGARLCLQLASRSPHAHQRTCAACAPNLRQDKSWKGGRHVGRKPFEAIQGVRLPPGKGAARQPEASLARAVATLLVKRRQQVLKPCVSPDIMIALKPSACWDRGQQRCGR